MRGVLLGLAILLAAGKAAAVDAPFLWQVKGPQATHYLLGSVHMLPASVYPLPPALEQAYAQTRGLVLETDVIGLEKPGLQMRMIEAGLNGRGLDKEIGPALYARVRQRAQVGELPATACDRFKAWMCALALTMSAFHRAGMDPKFGLDQHFHELALADGREITWLEAPELQLELFASMDATMSGQFLVAALDDLAHPQRQPAAMVRMWRDNDTAALGELIDDTRAEFPATHARLLGDRNRAWIAALVGKFGGATPQLVVVGAGHLVGQGNVLDLLEARGFAPKAVAESP